MDAPQLSNFSVGPPTTVSVGTIVAFALSVNNVPANWLLCDGGTISASYPDFIQALGSTKTPNLVGRVLVSSGTPTSSDNATQQNDGLMPQFNTSLTLNCGDTGGEWVHTLSIAEMPSHTHTINKDHGGFGYHYQSFDGSDNGSDYPFETSPNNPVPNTDSTGGDGAHNTTQPYYVVNYIIYTGGQ